jgi:type IV pilus assembly protein PilA
MSTCLVVLLVFVALAIPVGGVVAATAIYGFRRYLLTARTAEAKNTLSAIARAALAAYEREAMDEQTLRPGASRGASHRLCGSAVPVPAAVPKAARYMPSSSPGADFHTGDASTGWMCLKFAMTEPFYYQYMYAKGSGSGKAGAPATGFEVSARGDLDGNGVTSFFARIGDVRGGQAVVSNELYIENEFE